MTSVNFTTTPTEKRRIAEIIRRAIRLELISSREKLDATMDLTACHANGTPLDFDKLLRFDDFNFAHDVAGIRRHMNRDTGQLTHCFLPKCAQPRPSSAASDHQRYTSTQAADELPEADFYGE
jgi:hypothetical protein